MVLLKVFSVTLVKVSVVSTSNMRPHVVGTKGISGIIAAERTSPAIDLTPNGQEVF